MIIDELSSSTLGTSAVLLRDFLSFAFLTIMFFEQLFLMALMSLNRKSILRSARTAADIFLHLTFFNGFLVTAWGAAAAVVDFVLSPRFSYDPIEALS